MIEKAKLSDKLPVVDFCKNTFSWGDYISDVWDLWIKEGNLLIIREKSIPIAICHVSISNKDKQAWIEGIRVHPNYRKKGLAKNLISKSEEIACKNGCITSFMLIETTNSNSLSLARNLHYSIKDTWNFFSLLPKKATSKVSFINYEKKTPPEIFIPELFFVNSWRWYPLKSYIESLSKKKKIIFSTKNNKILFAVITESKHFEGTMIVTVSGDPGENKQLFKYFQNLAYKQKFKRIQILTKLDLHFKFGGLEKRLSFHLMEKNLSNC